MAVVEAHITGTVWKIEGAVGDAIEEGDTVAILESMKMEMPVEAEDGGTVTEIVCTEGQAVSEGDPLVGLEEPGAGAAAGARLACPRVSPSAPTRELADGKLLVDEPAAGRVRLQTPTPATRTSPH